MKPKLHIILAIAIALSGCLANPPLLVHTAIPANSPANDPPQLIEIPPQQLRDQAAQHFIPKNEYHALRIILTADAWHYDRSGHPITTIALVHNATHQGTAITAASWPDPKGLPAANFTIVPLNLLKAPPWARPSLTHTLEYDCIRCTPPAAEIAWFLGSPTQALEARVGILWEGESERALWKRDPIPVRADATTDAAFSGMSLQWATDSAEEGHAQYSLGVLAGAYYNNEFLGMEQRTTTLKFSKWADARGLHVMSYEAYDTEGIEDLRVSYIVGDKSIEGSWSQTYLGASSVPFGGSVTYLHGQAVTSPTRVGWEVDRLVRAPAHGPSSMPTHTEVYAVAFMAIDPFTLYRWQSVEDSLSSSADSG